MHTQSPHSNLGDPGSVKVRNSNNNYLIEQHKKIHEIKIIFRETVRIERQSNKNRSLSILSKALQHSCTLTIFKIRTCSLMNKRSAQIQIKTQTSLQVSTFCVLHITPDVYAGRVRVSVWCYNQILTFERAVVESLSPFDSSETTTAERE